MAVYQRYDECPNTRLALFIERKRMSKCPHCKQNSISTFKVHSSNPGIIFTCVKCHKKSMTPWWPKAYLIAIVLAYLSIQLYVGFGFEYLPVLSAIIILIIVVSLKFSLLPVQDNGDIHQPKTYIIKSIYIFFGLFFLAFSLRTLIHISNIDKHDYIENSYSQYMPAPYLAVVEKINSLRFPYAEFSPISITRTGQYSYLTLAIYSGNHQAILGMLERGDNLNFVDKNNRTPLSMALVYKEYGIAEKLLSHGAKLDYSKNSGNRGSDYLYTEFSYDSYFTSMGYDSARFTWLLSHELNINNKSLISTTLEMTLGKCRDSFVEKLKKTLLLIPDKNSYQRKLENFALNYENNKSIRDKIVAIYLKNR